MSDEMKSENLNVGLRHLDYLGLRYNPFPVAPDTEDFFFSENVDRIVTEIVHGVVTRKGFLVFSGEIGLGKTTISRKVMAILEEKNVETSLVFNTLCQETDLIREINRDFGLNAESPALSDEIRVLNDFLLSRNREGGNCAVIIDDAQNLSLKSLEFIRMISNLEADREKLVQILLIGQPELLDKLNLHELRQLKSRIMIREEARPLTRKELTDYVMFKLNLAGNTGRISVGKDAMKRIHRFTKGNFRQVNILMERCLYVAFLYNRPQISRKVVTEAQRDLHPGNYVSVNRRLAWGFFSVLVLCLSVGAFFPGNVFEIAPPAPPAPDGEPNISSPDSHSHTDVRHNAVADFLAGYDLSGFQEAFLAGMKEKRLDEVAGSIQEATGYEMVRFDAKDRIPDGYGVLNLSGGENGCERRILFWKPCIRVTRFYLGYHGKEIMKLQELFADVKLYNFSLDGIVGLRLVTSVNRFQDAVGLDVTGLPDEKTIFMLCRAQEDIRL